LATPHPNIVFVFPDQFRQQALGCMNADPVRTPNLDRFAAQSLVLTHAVSNYPVCSPYRAMLFTGRYPFHNHVTGNCYSETRSRGVFLRPEHRCITDVLHDAGYSLGYIGKYHLDTPGSDDARFGEGLRGDGRIWDAYTPPGPRRHGIDFWHSYGCCDRHMRPHYWIGNAPVDQPTEFGEWSVKHETDVAVDYILNQERIHRVPGKPFALFVAFNPPHTPFDQVPPQYLDMYRHAEPEQLLNRPNLPADDGAEAARRWVRHYFAAVTGIDEQFGRILLALDDAGLRDDTIVVFTADHGEMMGSHGRMHKDVIYDESFLVPFLIRWPGRLPARRDDLLLSVPDIMPTLLTLAGLRRAVPPEVDGRDRSDIFLGKPGDRPESALYLAPKLDAPRRGKRGIRTHRWAYVVDRDATESDPKLLFDCLEDPYQLRNVAAERPEAVRELEATLRDWLARTGDPWSEE